MTRKIEFTKALRLLDASREEDAVALLNQILNQSLEESDTIYAVRSSCALGEYYLSKGQLPEAREKLNITIGTAVDEDEAEILSFEIDHARELLQREL